VVFGSSDQQLLAAVPADLPGVSSPPPAELVGVSASHTGQFNLDNVLVEERWLIAGPMPDVMSQGVGAGTGGLQTSTLAIGHAHAAIEFVEAEAERRAELSVPASALRKDYEQVHAALLAAVRGEPACSSELLRQQANSLALRAAQAALAAAKGTGYVVGHPAGRWCREALFFLVWSCPQPVVNANLCELAGIVE
jgi:alkylation response protein AidB-like acyl-CoA dehydrogenase